MYDIFVDFFGTAVSNLDPNVAGTLACILGLFVLSEILGFIGMAFKRFFGFRS